MAMKQLGTGAQEPRGHRSSLEQGCHTSSLFWVPKQATPRERSQGGRLGTSPGTALLTCAPE